MNTVSKKESKSFSKAFSDDFDKLYNQGRNYIEKQARCHLINNPSYDEFVMGMGIVFFTKRNGDYTNFCGNCLPLTKFLNRWDSVFKFSGECMRFTANGKTRTK